jgi:hypothetical protein
MSFRAGTTLFGVEAPRIPFPRLASSRLWYFPLTTGTFGSLDDTDESMNLKP